MSESEQQTVYTGRTAGQIQHEYQSLDLTLFAGDIEWSPRLVAEVREVQRATEKPATFEVDHHPSSNALDVYHLGLATAEENEVVVIEGIATSGYANGPYTEFKKAVDRGATVTVEGDAPEGEYRPVDLREFDSYSLYVIDQEYEDGSSEREYSREHGCHFRLVLAPEDQ